jgi:enoyl-CoA hydratase/carnithine racemase
VSIALKLENQVAILTIQRPEVYNCLNYAALLSLKEKISEISANNDVRVVIVTGEGDRAFCSGADLKERKSMTAEQVAQYIVAIRDTFTALEKLPQPVIAAINGVALGGGTELALSCDLRVMAEDAVMGLTETSLGVIPGAGGTQRLARLIGKGLAKELIFTARKVEASEALRIALVNQVSEPGGVLEKARELAQSIASNAPLALAQAKFAIDYGTEADLATGLAIESNAYQVLIPTQDRLEGLQAFAEKRKPIYKGK